MSSREKFKHLYDGEWLYEPSVGVGIHLIGIPLSSEDFISTLANFSCNRFAALRILNELMLSGERKATVMYHLDFLKLEDEMRLLGVELKIIPPGKHSSSGYFEASSNWDKEIKMVLEDEIPVDRFLTNKTPIERKIFLERLEDTQLSMALLHIEEINK